MKKSLKKSLKKAQVSEKKLISFYRNYFVDYNKKMNKLYDKHISNLEKIDNELPSLNSMKALFTDNIPSILKKKKIKESEITYINNYYKDYIYLHL